ncbi:MAG: RluA family pseudouridine synthase [Bdellovibrionota bacterium]
MGQMIRLDALVRSRHQLSWGKARDWIESGKIWHLGRALTDGSLKLDESTPLELKMNAPRSGISASPRELEPLDAVHLDTQLIVVNKPAGVSTVPYDERDRDTLEQRVCRHLRQPRVVVVHRVDRETSGLVVFARTKEAGKALSNQFRFHTVQRRYFALVHGQVRSQVIRSLLVENRGDGLRGSATRAHSRTEAKEAITHVTALRNFDGKTLIECRLETGRTHQIRIHLSEAGHPLLGEKAYCRDYPSPLLSSPRLMLHAAELGFSHPAGDTPVRWTRMPPPDFLDLAGAEGRALMEQRLAIS